MLIRGGSAHPTAHSATRFCLTLQTPGTIFIPRDATTGLLQSTAALLQALSRTQAILLADRDAADLRRSAESVFWAELGTQTVLPSTDTITILRSTGSTILTAFGSLAVRHTSRLAAFLPQTAMTFLLTLFRRQRSRRPKEHNGLLQRRTCPA